MRILILGLSDGVEFIAAADGCLVLCNGEGRRIIEKDSAEGLRDFLLDHYPVPVLNGEASEPSQSPPPLNPQAGKDMMDAER